MAISRLLHPPRVLPRPVRSRDASHAVEQSRERDRILAIDAVRGLAMVFVGVSHIRYYAGADHALAALLLWLGYLASPAFLLISGIACGYQFNKSTSRDTVSRIVDRGLFVLLVGHLLVCGSLVYEVTGHVFEHIVITDTIGLFICLSPLVRYVPARQLFVAAAALFIVTCVVALAWQPSSTIDADLAGLLFGIDAGDVRASGWMTPTLAYFAFFIAGVGIGRLIGRLGEEGRSYVLASRLLYIGMAAMMASVALNVFGHFLKPAALAAGSHWMSALLTTTDARHQAPPMPAYALFYGGTVIATLGALMRVSAQSAPGLLLEPLRLVVVIGQASFISYVCIQWLVDYLPRRIGLDAWLTPGMALLYLVLVVIVVYWMASVWERHRANRYLTLGLSSS